MALVVLVVGDEDGERLLVVRARIVAAFGGLDGFGDFGGAAGFCRGAVAFYVGGRGEEGGEGCGEEEGGEGKELHFGWLWCGSLRLCCVGL